MILWKKCGLRIADCYFDDGIGAATGVGADLIRYYQWTHPVAGCQGTPFWTRVINLRLSPQRIFEQMVPDTRRQIRRAESKDVNTWRQHDLQRFRRDVEIYRKRIISVGDAILRFGQRRRDWRVRVVEGAFPRLLRTRLRLRSWLAHMSSPSPTSDLGNRLQPDLGTSFVQKDDGRAGL